MEPFWARNQLYRCLWIHLHQWYHRLTQGIEGGWQEGKMAACNHGNMCKNTRCQDRFKKSECIHTREIFSWWFFESGVFVVATCWRISWKITTHVLKTGKYYINRLPSWRNLMNPWWLLERNSIWVVVSKIFGIFSLIWKKPILTNIFQVGWFNHQLGKMGGQQKLPEVCWSESCSCLGKLWKFNAWIVRRSFENDLNPKSTGPTSMVSGSLCCNNRGGVRFLLLVYRDCENVLMGILRSQPWTQLSGCCISVGL